MPRQQKQNSTRRNILQAGLAVFGGAVAVGSARAADSEPAEQKAVPAPAVTKFSPEAVHYQPTPHDWQKCLFCTYFQAPSTCWILTGPVSKQGWCDHFALLHE